MTAMMKAAVVREFGKPLAIEELPIPDPGPEQILVRYQATGVCHTDLHAAQGDWPVKPSPPFIPGHEGTGFVAKVGANVRRIKEGDRVGVPWLHTACGCCNPCRTGWETLCGQQQNTGYSVNGTFAEYGLADPAFVGRLPDKSCIRPGGSGVVRRRHSLQRIEGDRSPAGRVGGYFRCWWSRAYGCPVCQGHGHACRGG